VELEKRSIPQAIQALMREIKGAYSTVLATRDRMYMFRDPYAFRPMVYGRLEDGTIAVASENCALDILGAHQHHEVPPAGILWVESEGLHEITNDPMQYRNTEGCRHCVFEHIYFSRPDSYIFGENVYEVRQRIGAALAEADADLRPDMVVPVPDSSNFIALGYGKRKGVPFEMGLIRNTTWAAVHQAAADGARREREPEVQPPAQFLPGQEGGAGGRLHCAGTTIRKLVRLLLREGAAEVHLRVGSPPVMHSCFYGIDTPTRSELIAPSNSVEQIREYLGATSLRYLTIEQLHGCTNIPQDYCDACFTGDYPIPKEEAL
jgi:amidophosphoribosyltransferase